MSCIIQTASNANLLLIAPPVLRQTPPEADNYLLVAPLCQFVLPLWSSISPRYPIPFCNFNQNTIYFLCSSMTHLMQSRRDLIECVVVPPHTLLSLFCFLFCIIEIIECAWPRWSHLLLLLLCYCGCKQ